METTIVYLGLYGYDGKENGNYCMEGSSAKHRH